ncbi:unnamed protein product [Adineta ricciae]|uniref:Uncharacterized protein n=1 Tax=Adineta ricciae TaxID=249248 RepID=A0A814BK87_ADIRI|nr:unnamed protein product [Adineta ricciae]
MPANHSKRKRANEVHSSKITQRGNVPKTNKPSESKTPICNRMADVNSLRQRLSLLVDEITRDIQVIETTRNLNSKHRVELSINEATRLARDLERLDSSYGREYKQRIDAIRQRLENVSRIPVHGAWNSGFDPEVDRLGQQQRDALLRGHASIVRTGEALNISRQTAYETEQLGNEIMADLTTQRETLLRTQDRLNEGNEHLKAGSKTLRLMYSSSFSSQMNSNLSLQWEKLSRPGICTLFYREYPLMELRDDACQRIQEFLYKILRFLLRQYPHRAELEQWLYINYPEAQYALNRNSRKRIFSIDQLQTLIHKEFGSHNEMDISYLATTLEHCTKDLLKLAHDYVNRLGKNEIVANDIDLIMNADTIFVEILRSDLNHTSNSSSTSTYTIDTSIAAMSYNELIRHFIITETQYKDDLELLIKLFRNPLRKFFEDQPEIIDDVFGCLDDIYELTTKFLSDLEDAKEMRDDNTKNISLYEPFQNFIEGNEFECYTKYTHTILAAGHNDQLKKLLDHKHVKEYLEAKPDQMKETHRYLLPALLHTPIHHFQQYLIYLEKLALFPESESAQLTDVLSVLRQNSYHMKRSKLNMNLSIHSFTMPKLSENKTNNWKNIIENWDLKESTSLIDSHLKHIVIQNSNIATSVDRRAILFSTVLCLCKAVSNDKWKFKEKIWLRKFNINNEIILADHPHVFEIQCDDKNYILQARSEQDKVQWLCLLMYIRNKSVLQRELYNILVNEDAQQVLLTPDPSQYKFCTPNSPTNILIDYHTNDKSSSSPSFTIRGATIEKLIEHLTHHQLLHPRFVKSFLMTYKSYCSPLELLNLLIERYNIPEPASSYLYTEQQLKKFRKEYVQPVKLRVLNVIRQWVDKYFSDLVESNGYLLDQLRNFLQSVSDTGGLYQFKTSILKLIDKQTVDYENSSKKNQQQDLINNERDQIEDLDVFLFDMKELSDQITLICSNYFRAITSQELLYRLPNLYNLQNYMKFLDKVLGFWCKRSILETSNLEERVAVTERFIQIAIRTYEKKNFAAVFALIFGGIIDLEKSLPHTWDRLSKQSRTFVTLVDDMLGEDSHFKLYFEKLRQSPLPVVPFIANNQTRIAQMKEKHNMIVLPTGEILINFRKFQQIGEHLSEIQQYQNMPYDIQPNYDIQRELKRLNPMRNFPDENTFQNYLVTLKEQIEPVDQPPKVFPTRRPTSAWRSHSRVSRLFMIPSHPRTSSQCDEQHRKSTSDISSRKDTLGVQKQDNPSTLLGRQASLDINTLTSIDTFAFDNSLCESTDELQSTTNKVPQPPPVPPRLPRPGNGNNKSSSPT